MNEILLADGMEALVRLAEKTAHPGLVGQTAAAATITGEQKRSFLAFFLGHADGRSETVVRCFVESLFKEEGTSLPHFIAKYGRGIDGRPFGMFALGLPVGPEAWDAVESAWRRSGGCILEERYIYPLTGYRLSSTRGQGKALS